MRHRWMYQLSGLPGWMRFGFSPGWMGRSPSGLGPAAQYLMTGTWPTPQMNHAWQQGFVPFSSMPGYPAPYDPWGAAEVTPEKEIEFLKAEAKRIKDELAAIEKRIKEREGEKK